MKSNNARSIITLALAGLVSFLGTVPAQAELRRFVFEYSGADHGNNARATGFMMIDDDPAVFNNPGNNGFPAQDFIKDFQITVSRASDRTHNGTFDAADYDGIGFNTSGGGADLNKELVGQADFSSPRFIAMSSSLAPDSSQSSFTVLAGNGTGDAMSLTSFRPVVSSSVRVYKCTLVTKGVYKYCDRSFNAPGVPQWVCKRFRSRTNFYMSIDSLSGKLGFLWVDRKNRYVQSIIGAELPQLDYAQCRPPTASAPAGRWEVCLPLWCHLEDIDIDNDTNVDARRCRILCLNGIETLRRFTFNDKDTDERISLRDFAVARFNGSFCQSTRYDTVHYAFEDPKKDRVLRWPTPRFGDAGQIRPGKGSSCIVGTISCRLDTKRTSEALANERKFGPGVSYGITAVTNHLFRAGEGWSGHTTNPIGPPDLQPIGSETLEPLIP